LAQRWLNYFKDKPAALEVDVGGTTGSLRNLVMHIFQVEGFFATLLLHEGMVATRRPAPIEVAGFEDLERMHRDANNKLAQYIGSADQQTLQKTRTLGPVTVSNRKMLAQAVLHSIHHWAQVAMEVRQAGFPMDKPQDIIASPVMD